MSPQDTERAAALERRYRRLLRCYPPGHRQVHREEMLGVLLATARPGQRAPGARQTVNLVACGLAIRARRALGSLAGEYGNQGRAGSSSSAVSPERGRLAGLRISDSGGLICALKSAPLARTSGELPTRPASSMAGLLEAAARRS